VADENMSARSQTWRMSEAPSAIFFRRYLPADLPDEAGQEF
jgi:hypothetical protein